MDLSHWWIHVWVESRASVAVLSSRTIDLTEEASLRDPTHPTLGRGADWCGQPVSCSSSHGEATGRLYMWTMYDVLGFLYSVLGLVDRK